MVDGVGLFSSQKKIGELISNNWGDNGERPSILYIWEETMLKYDDTDSYILINPDVEILQIYSMKEGAGIYHWLHTIPFTIDVRIFRPEGSGLMERSEQIVNNVVSILKNNIIKIANNIDIVLGDITTDNTRKFTMRFIIHIQLRRMDPTT